jgi:hypothetical protein
MEAKREWIDVDFEYPETEEEAENTPAIEDTVQTEAHLRSLSYWRYEIAQIRAHADKERERIALWEREQIAKIAPKIRWHENGLRAFLESAGKKTLKLIHGTLKRIAGRSRVEVQDFEEFKKWNEANDYFMLRVKTEPDKVAVAAHVKATGEIPDGCDLVTGEDSFKIETE